MEKIKFYEKRDFGSNFNVTFQFLKQNYGAICKTLIYFIPLFLIVAYIFKTPSGIFNNIETSDFLALNYLISIGCGYLLYLIGIFLINTYVTCYVVEYAESEKEKVLQADVWKRVKKNILPIFLCSILYTLAFWVGFILCIIPGIVIMIYWIFYAYAYIAHDKSITGCFSNSYYLVKENWWMTFGYFILFSFGIIMSQGIFAMPAYCSMVGHLLNIESLSGDVFSYFATLMSYLGYLFTSPIIIIAMGVMYYSLRADVYGVDLSSAINQIGSSESDEK